MSELLLAGVGDSEVRRRNKQVYISGSSQSPSTTATQYHAPGFGSTENWFGTETSRQVGVPIPGRVKSLHVEVETAPGAGASWTITLRRNSASTPVVVTIADTATQGSIEFEQTLSLGDIIGYQSIPSAGTAPAAAGGIRLVLEVEWLLDRFVLLGGASTNLATAGADQFHIFAPSTGSVFSATENLRRVVVPTDCVMKEFLVRLNASPGATRSYNFSIYRNGVEISESVITIADTATIAKANVNVAISAGDVISFHAISVNTPTARRPSFSVSFQPSVKYSFPIWGNIGAPNASEYIPPQGTSSSSATEAFRDQVATGPFDFTIRNFYVDLNTAPGAGTSRTYSFRKNGAGALSVTISNTATSGSDLSNSTSVTAWDDISILHTVSGSPAAGGHHRFAVLCVR